MTDSPFVTTRVPWWHRVPFLIAAAVILWFALCAFGCARPAPNHAARFPDPPAPEYRHGRVISMRDSVGLWLRPWRTEVGPGVFVGNVDSVWMKVRIAHTTIGDFALTVGMDAQPGDTVSVRMPR